MRTVAIINQKGGTGKTTTAINLAAGLSRRGLRCVLVDLDPQSHCAMGLAVPSSGIDLHIGDALAAPPDRPCDLSRMLWRVARNLDLIPSSTSLAGIESARGGLADRPDRERRLTDVLAGIAPDYDWCVIDCPPSIGLLTFNALRASHEVLIPVETGYFALEQASKQVHVMRALARRAEEAAMAATDPETPGGIDREAALRPAPLRFAVVPTMHDPASTLAEEVLAELRRRFGERVAPVFIRHDPKVRESAAFGLPVCLHSPESPGAQDYEALATWLTGVRPDPVDDEPPMVHTTGLASASLDAAMQARGAREAALVGAAEGGSTPRVALRPTVVAPPGVEAVDVDSVPRARPAAMSRAAELAARARQLLDRGAELQRKLTADPAVARVLEEIAPPPPEQAAPPVLGASHAAAKVDRRLLGVRHTSRGVLFVQPAMAGTVLSIAGDHNGWSPTATPMRFNAQAGVHEALLPLAEGKHRYRIVCDGNWTVDPYNPACEPNPWGELNSIVVVEKSAPAPLGDHASRTDRADEGGSP